MIIWRAEERAGLGDSAGYIQRLISVPLVKDQGKGSFDVYYYIPNFPRPKMNALPERTLLFCSGGPGRVLKPHDSLWFKGLSLNGYRIVYFHLRGSGFSQLPESNECDDFIRTDYAVDDIEEIRKDVFGENSETKWDAVIGYSYGAVLAQQYAAKYENCVDKVILIGPISLANFVINPAGAYESYSTDVRRIRAEIVDRIYRLDVFDKLTNAQKQAINEKLFGEDAVSESSDSNALGIFRRIELNFGSEQAVINNYEKIVGSLTGHNLAYSLEFFQALRELHLYGWRTDNDGAINQKVKLTEIGEIIAQELKSWPEGRSTTPAGTPKTRPRTNAPRSSRVFEVMGVYDGINRRFIREWLLNTSGKSGKDRIAAGMDKAAGTVLAKMPDNIAAYKKVKLIAEDIKPWRPDADGHKHQRPTLIIKGTADPVTADNQAESYLYGRAVGNNNSVLLGFEGVGHEFLIPAVNVKSAFVSSVLREVNADTLNCLVSVFIEKDFQDFKNAASTIADVLLSEENLSVTPLKPEG